MEEKIIKRCVEDYFLEDRIVMLDESLMRIKGVIFYIYDLIYFGNKIVISEDTLNKIKKYSRRITSKLFSNNASYLLDSIKKDKEGNYKIIDLSQYGEKSSERLINYLKENDNIIYLLESEKFYTTLKEEGLVHQLKLLETRTKIFSVCKNYSSKFATLEIIKHEKKRMFIIAKNVKDAIVKVYKSSGKEKEGDNIEINVDDIILTRYERNTKYIFYVYRIISRHSKHQAVKILWTDIEKGVQSNFYVEKLEEMYKKIIQENIS